MRTAQRFALLAGGRAWTKLREQDSVRAWKMLENAAESHPSSARFVRRISPIQGAFDIMLLERLQRYLLQASSRQGLGNISV